ncbi:cobalamin biosynthesis protein CobW [Occultella glacieicola]|uniref:Cobalamin biosynthesis protein CobW n=1 Tax=Occultella glacieicola TaxID=2518684 RepID=A0ABY2DX06_9MICO|nr:GTP-binding protein [Occultella glacieicola]TDE88314.1 cobalamin biosynthesis protein CobW [Occultella glacieicola]
MSERAEPQGPPRTPVTVLASVDPIDREIALGVALVDRPDVVAVVHDLVNHRLRRRILHAGAALEDTFVDLDHVCPACAVREDAVPVLARLAETGSYGGMILALPAAAELLPAVRGLAQHLAPGGALSRIRLGATVSLVNPDTLATDLLGEEDLADRDLMLTHGDHRAVGEVLLGQLPIADAVLLTTPARTTPPPRVGISPATHATHGAHLGSDLLDALRAPESTRWEDAHEPWLSGVLGHPHSTLATERRVHPLSMEPGPGADLRRAGGGPDSDGATGGPDGDRSGEPAPSGVWTLDLRSPVAVHPSRLLTHIDALINGPRVVRGRFWVPNRPDSVCGVLGAGRQLSVGVASRWNAHPPHTRFLVVGAGPHADAVAQAFSESLLTPAEQAEGLAAWLDREDDLEPFLGARSSSGTA